MAKSGESPRYLVVGFARTGQAVAEALVREGHTVVAADDAPRTTATAAAHRLGVELAASPSEDELEELVADADFVIVSPGVPPAHAVYALASPEKLLSELDLAQDRAKVPVIAVTGTNGKTTVVSLVAAMLRRSGVRAAASGNIGYPLITAVADPDLDVVVAEVSSFQLTLARTFRPHVATWLNFSDNHLDWHGSVAAYRQAKARIWMNQDRGDVTVANIDDPVVQDEARRSEGRLVTFGAWRGDYHLEGDAFIAPSGPAATTADLGRDLPHDRLNALAAIATAMESGASGRGVRGALSATELPPHRIAHVADVDGVSYYDDSKATTPAAVSAALAGFSSVVLILGGRNKGLDLSAIRRAAENDDAASVRGVIAIGESAGEVRSAFAPDYEVREAHSMDEAVEKARRLARLGDAVLLSPGCASFDWYESYEARGDDFARLVRALADARKP